MIVETYYQAVGIVFGSWCLIQGIIDGLRQPKETKKVKTWERVKYKEEEIEVNKINKTINFEL
jgi:hypothetical protein